MVIDMSQTPYVYLREEVESDVSIEDQFRQLLDRNQPFILITNHKDYDHSEDTQEERKEKALLFKRIKERMGKLCRGMIIMEGNTPTSAPMRLVATTASKAFGFAVVFVSSEALLSKSGEGRANAICS
jgi:hypothetical protein